MSKLERMVAIVSSNSNFSGPICAELPLSYLGLDSLEFVYLIHEVENTFGCKIEDSQYASLNTVADILAVLP